MTFQRKLLSYCNCNVSTDTKIVKVSVYRRAVCLQAEGMIRPAMVWLTWNHSHKHHIKRILHWFHRQEKNNWEKPPISNLGDKGCRKYICLWGEAFYFRDLIWDGFILSFFSVLSNTLRSRALVDFLKLPAKYSKLSTKRWIFAPKIKY